ncbi:MAG: response regulator [Lachnospiraceae bacterium]|nr:response regulator [Lachnospiraceae bacterium]
MIWYALIGALAMSVLVMENHDILFHGKGRRKDIQIYRRFLFGIMTYYATDILWGILDDLHLTALLYVVTVVYYVAMAVCVLLWTEYVVAYLAETNAYGRLLAIVGHVFFSVVFVVTVINCFTPVLFWFDADGVYHVCPARHAQLVFQIVMFVMTSVYTFRSMRRTEGTARNRYRTIYLFGLVVAGLLLVQLKYPFLPLYTIGFMLGSCLLHIFVVGNEMDEYRQEISATEAANKAKSTFLSNMSHEIRTPINAILGMNEMILRESSEENILEYSESVRTAGQSLLGLVNDILDFSRIEAGKLEIVPVDYDLSSVLNDLVLMVRSRADEKGLTLKLDFDRDTPKRLHGDEVRIKQAVTNILTNAVKYTEKGGITFTVGFERVPDDEESVQIRVAVRDTGIGIRQEDMEKLFSEFERIEEGRNRYVEGTGLGMSITVSLLEMMGSSLQVESEYGKGSTFSFSLRQRVISWEPLGDYGASFREHLMKRREYRERFTAEDARVLVVDDNLMNLTVFKALVGKTLIKVDTADSGGAGLALARKKKYDLIFLDHMMPEKDGIETLQELKAGTDGPNARTPVVCLTANAISGSREIYLSAGFDDYLTKPINADLLEKLLMQYLPENKVERRVVSEEEETEADSVTDLPDPLRELDEQSWIDVRTGVKNSGSTESYLPILRIFYTSLQEKAEELERLYAEKDLKNYTIKVHALKSSARIIGAAAFGEEAQALEDAGKREDLAYINGHHDGFMEEYRSFEEPLSAVFPEEENAERPVADPELMDTVYKELHDAADDMDCDRLQAILKEMEEYSVPEQDTERWKAITDAVNNYDYDGVLRNLP